MLVLIHVHDPDCYWASAWEYELTIAMSGNWHIPVGNIRSRNKKKEEKEENEIKEQNFFFFFVKNSMNFQFREIVK